MNGGNKFANGIYYVNVKAIASADANQLDSTATKKITIELNYWMINKYGIWHPKFF